MKKILFSLMMAFIPSLIAFGGDTPGFPGGDSALQSYITKNLQYPQIAKENGVEGVVIVGFIVMPDGSLKQLKVVKMVDPDLEQEALRLVGSMPAWIPADKNGTPVEAQAKVEVPFILE